MTPKPPKNPPSTTSPANPKPRRKPRNKPAIPPTDRITRSTTAKLRSQPTAVPPAAVAPAKRKTKPASRSRRRAEVAQLESSKPQSARRGLAAAPEGRLAEDAKRKVDGALDAAFVPTPVVEAGCSRKRGRV